MNSLVSLRNDLVHGGTVNVTINTVYKYFVSGKTVIEWLEDIIQKTIIKLYITKSKDKHLCFFCFKNVKKRKKYSMNKI